MLMVVVWFVLSLSSASSTSWLLSQAVALMKAR